MAQCPIPACPHMQPCPTHARRSEQRYEQRRAAAGPRLYGHRWQLAARVYLANNPLCRECEARGRLRPSTDVDHVRPHAGDIDLFWDESNWQPLCQTCHARKTRREQVALIHGHEIMPSNLKPSAIPLVIVCGPPGSGKTTYVEQHRQKEDALICLDTIMSEISGLPIHQAGAVYLDRALVIRNRMIAALSSSTAPRAWFIVSAPRLVDQQLWKQRLRAQSVVVLDVAAEECKRRLRSANRPDIERIERAVDDWWLEYQR